MAGWQRNLSQVHQEFANAIFHCRYVDCDSTFYWMPYLNSWFAVFKTKFKYLSFTEKNELNNDFLNGYDCFVKEIEGIREKIEREYHNYFNELWG